MDIGDIKGGVWCHGAYVTINNNKETWRDVYNTLGGVIELCNGLLGPNKMYEKVFCEKYI